MTEKQKTIESRLQVEDKNTSALSNDVSSVKNATRENTLEVLLDKLIRHFEARKHLYREKQVIAFEQLIKHLQEGNNKGLIKLPMGTGKTFLFAEIAKALGLPTIVLVPRIGLVNDTKEEMVGSDKKLGVGFKDEEVYTISSKATGTSAEQLQKIFDVNDGKFDGVLVTTYASLNSLRRSSPELFGILIECCGFIVSDEAHRSLGEQTKEAGDELFAGEIGNDAEKAERELEEVLEESFKGKVHLFTTATPRLIDKDVRDDNDTIYSATIQEVADSGDLIIPKRVSVGKSFLHIERSNEEDQRFRLSEADLSGPLDKYRDIDGNPLYETLSNKYVEEKEKAGGYLPGVGFCTTVDQAEFVTKHLNSIGVRAVRCTSDKPGVSKSVSDTEAKRMLENNEVDVVVTCTKVGEGWDVPTLRSAIWYTPTQSPVKNLQGNGRIMRTISEHLADIYRKAMGLAYKEKNQDNTMIIEPESWEVVAFDGDMVDMDRDGGGWGEKIEGVGSLKTISGSHEMMYDVGELEKGYLDGEGIELVKKYDETETMSEEELIEFHKQQLEELGIIGMEGLIRFGPTEYRNQFGKMIAGRILGDIPNSITVSVLHSMGISLGFEEMLLEGNLNRDELIKKHKSDLENIGINNAFELIDFGSVKYIRNFGRYPIGKILGRVIDSINKEILQELGELLFGIQEDKTIENHKIKLAELGILNNDDLLSFGAKKYQKRFGVTIAGKILGESTRLVTKERLYDIGIAIGFGEVFMIEKLSIEELTKKHKVDLTNIGIQDTYSLVNFSPRDYRDKFGLAIIGKILGQSTTTITIEKLQELGELIFGIQEDKTIENYKLELESFGIYNNNTLLDFGVNAFRDKIGVLVAGKILGQSIGRITIEILQELGEILFGSLKEETIKIHKNELRGLEITDFEGLLKLGVVKYKKSFGKISIIRILGYSPDIIKKDNLKELGEAIFGIQEDTTLKDHKEKLSLLGIQNTKQLIEFGPTNYRGKFGNAVAGKVLGYPLKSINKNIIKELGEALFPEDKK